MIDLLRSTLAKAVRQAGRVCKWAVSRVHANGSLSAALVISIVVVVGLAWINLEAVPSAVWVAIATFAALLAAIFTAMSADAARVATHEMRQSRYDEAEPRLSFSLTTRVLNVRIGPTHATPIISAEEGGEDLHSLAIQIHNFGGGAALDVEVRFECLAAVEIAKVQEVFATGLGDQSLTASWFGESFLSIQGKHRFGIAFRKIEQAFLMHCAPGMPEMVEMPYGSLRYAGVSAICETSAQLQEDAPSGHLSPIEIHVSYKTVHGHPRSERFRFRLDLVMAQPNSPSSYLFRLEQLAKHAGK